MTQTMDAARSLQISFSMYEYDGTAERHHEVYGGYPHPRDIDDPPGITNRAWVPQTVYDSIWKLYEFETKAQRDEFMQSPPEVYAAATINERKQAFYDHWVAGKLSSPADW